MSKLDEIKEIEFIQHPNTLIRWVVMTNGQRDWLVLEIERLKKALEKYGNHLHHCDTVRHSVMLAGDECTCGFQEALKEE